MYFWSHFLYLKNGLYLIIFPPWLSAQPYSSGMFYKLHSDVLLLISSFRRCFRIFSCNKEERGTYFSSGIIGEQYHRAAVPNLGWLCPPPPHIETAWTVSGCHDGGRRCGLLLASSGWKLGMLLNTLQRAREPREGILWPRGPVVPRVRPCQEGSLCINFSQFPFSFPLTLLPLISVHSLCPLVNPPFPLSRQSFHSFPSCHQVSHFLCLLLYQV